MAPDWAPLGSSHWGLSPLRLRSEGSGATVIGASTEPSVQPELRPGVWREGESASVAPGSLSRGKDELWLGAARCPRTEPQIHTASLSPAPRQARASPRVPGEETPRASPQAPASQHACPYMSLASVGHRPLPPRSRQGHWGRRDWPSPWECPTIRPQHGSVRRSQGAGWPLPPRLSCDFMVVDPSPDPLSQRPGPPYLSRDRPENLELKVYNTVSFQTAASTQW